MKKNVVGGDPVLEFVVGRDSSAGHLPPRSAVLAGLVGFFFTNGFLFDTEGTLSWHGKSDLVRLTVMVGLAVVAALFGRLSDLQRQHETVRSTPTLRTVQR